MFEITISDRDKLYDAMAKAIEPRKELWHRIINEYKEDFINEKCEDSNEFCDFMEEELTEGFFNLLDEMGINY